MKTGIITLTVLLLSLSVSGCSGCYDQPTARASVSPHVYIFVIDISASRAPETISEDGQFLDAITQKLNFGDHVVLMQMQQDGLTDHPLHWAVNMPTPIDPTYPTVQDRGRLTEAAQSVRSAIPSFFKARVKVSHTDIFTTLRIADEQANDGGNKPKTVVLLSDMLQSAKGIEMQDPRRMPPTGWIEGQAHLGLLPKLGGACVVVVGADATTKSGAAVRDFWKRYFVAAGASLSPQDYRITPPPADQPLCH